MSLHTLTVNFHTTPTILVVYCTKNGHHYHCVIGQNFYLLAWFRWELQTEGKRLILDPGARVCAPKMTSLLALGTGECYAIDLKIEAFKVIVAGCYSSYTSTCFDPQTSFAIGSFKLISQTFWFWHIACVAVSSLRDQCILNLEELHGSACSNIPLVNSHWLPDASRNVLGCGNSHEPWLNWSDHFECNVMFEWCKQE